MNPAANPANNPTAPVRSAGQISRDRRKRQRQHLRRQNARLLKVAAAVEVFLARHQGFSPAREALAEAHGHLQDRDLPDDEGLYPAYNHDRRLQGARYHAERLRAVVVAYRTGEGLDEALAALRPGDLEESG